MSAQDILSYLLAGSEAASTIIPRYGSELKLEVPASLRRSFQLSNVIYNSSKSVR